MLFVKRTDYVLYEVQTEFLNICYMELEVQEFNVLWTGGDVDASGDEYDEDNGGGLVGEWHSMIKQASSVFKHDFVVQ